MNEHTADVLTEIKQWHAMPRTSCLVRTVVDGHDGHGPIHRGCFTGDAWDRMSAGTEAVTGQQGKEQLPRGPHIPGNEHLLRVIMVTAVFNKYTRSQ